MKIMRRLVIIVLFTALVATFGTAWADEGSKDDILKTLQSQAERIKQLEQSWLGDIEIHGFISQGFMYTTENNYLTLNSEDGSFEWHDAAINFSKQLTDRLRVGLQLYMYNLGDLGDYELELDWAYGDYQWKDWLGVRLGKIKTPMGLYNDVQDLEFIHTWVLLPQSVYPLGPRNQLLAHNGIDFYGNVGLGLFGSLTYQAYYGSRDLDENGGFYFNYDYSGKGLDDLDVKWLAGIDLKWETLLEGLLLGFSFMGEDYRLEGKTDNKFGSYPPGTKWELETDGYRETSQFCVEYAREALKLQAEYRRTLTIYKDNALPFLISKGARTDGRGMYAAVMYRFTDWFEAGSYFSKFYKNYSKSHSDPANVLEDWCLTLRFDVNSFWNIKVEGHSMDGTARGLFAETNPDGVKEDWEIFMIKTSFNF